jgi:HAD superfamily hydrolase (TIGR01509 family)
MIKLLVFDLDGVLVETKEMHYRALNSALGEISPEHKISLQDHLTIFDGLPTAKKLELLVKRGLNSGLISDISRLKQERTMWAIASSVIPNDKLQQTFQRLQMDGYKIYVASNAVRKTVVSILTRLGIIEDVDFIFSNEDVRNPKPNPEMYLRCMLHANVDPNETLIFEDSHTGRRAAMRSGGHLSPIDKPADVSYGFVKKAIAKAEGTLKVEKWRAKDTVVVIPMAGAGSRFEKAGYTFPKPLIEVRGKPMIQVVVENLNIDAEFVYIVQKAHFEKYNLGYLLNLITPGCKIVQVEGITEGAACTTLLAKEFMDTPDKHLVLANSDQFVDWDSHDFFYKVLNKKCDAAIATFKATHPKWSFAKVGDDGYVVEVAEKKPISDTATVGIYYWNKASDYVKYAEQMIDKNVRVNNEFYVCPVFNEAIENGSKIITYDVQRMWGIGTPEDLNVFLKEHP